MVAVPVEVFLVESRKLHSCGTLQKSWQSGVRQVRGRRNAGLRWANLALAILVLVPPIAHLLELPNKLSLSGPLWLAIQQHLYRGWGPYLAGPAEIGILGATLVRLLASRHTPEKGWCLVAAVAYAGMITVFLVFNDPVNRAVNGWTPATLASNWSDYRLRWEIGHALAALLAVIGLAATALSWKPTADIPRLD